MSGYLIIFLLAATLYVAFSTASYYTAYCLRIKYEMIDRVSELLYGLTFLSFGWWLLDRFFSGFDSGLGWWLLAFLVGVLVTLCIQRAVRHICNKKWLKHSDRPITTVKVHTSIGIAVDIFTLICFLAMDIFFIYALFANKLEGIGDIIIDVLLIALFSFGAYCGVGKIIKRIKHGDNN